MRRALLAIGATCLFLLGFTWGYGWSEYSRKNITVAYKTDIGRILQNGE